MTTSIPSTTRFLAQGCPPRRRECSRDGRLQRRVVLLLCAWAMLAGSHVRADRRDRSRPILISNVPAPTATVWQLGFAEVKGELTLFSAGADKMVRLWRIQEEPGEGGLAKVQLRAAGRITWSVYRENIGAIYAMKAVNDGVGTRLAFGGYNRKSAQVNVLYADEPNYSLSLYATLLNNQPVSSLDLYYDQANQSSWLAVGHHNTGEVRLWKVDRGDAEESTKKPHAILKWDELATVHRVEFSGDGRKLAVAGMKKDGRGFAAGVFDVATKATIAGTPAERYETATEIAAMAWCGASLVVGTAAKHDGTTAQGGGLSALGRPLSIPEDRRLTGRTIDALARLGSDALIVASSPATRGEQGHEVSVMDLVTGGTRQSLSDDMPFIARPMVLAVSPDCRWIAAAGLVRPRRDAPIVQIGLWRKDDNEHYRLSATIPDRSDAAAVVAPIAQVAVGGSAEKPVIGFKWGPWEDLPNKEIRRGIALNTRTMVERIGEETVNVSTRDKIKIKLPDPAIDDWKVGTLGPGSYVLVNRQNRNEWLGPLNGADKGLPLCYAWVPSNVPPERRKYLAVGYQYGILVWDFKKLKDLSAKGTKDTRPAILRSFHGHSQQVNCIASSADGSWLLSGSQDGTICAWSLRDLTPERPGGEMGVVLRWDPGTYGYYVADDPLPGSPAWEAGFTKGQYFLDPHRTWPKWTERLNTEQVKKGGLLEAFSVHHRGQAVDLWRFDQSVGLPRGMESDFRSGKLTAEDRRDGIVGWNTVMWPVPGARDRNLWQFWFTPGETLEVDVVSSAEGNTRLISRCSPDSLWTLYPLRNGQWFLHTPEGFYAKSSPEVEIGWLINHSGSQDLEVGGHELDRVMGGSFLLPEGHFEGALSLDRLAATAKQPQLLAEFLASGRTIGDFFKAQKLPNPLSNRPTRPRFHYNPPGGARDGAITVELIQTGTEPIDRMELRLNGWRLPEEQLTRQGKTKITASISRQRLRTTGGNELVAIAHIGSFRFADHHRLKLDPAEPVPPVVHFLGINNNVVHFMDAKGTMHAGDGGLPDCGRDVENVLRQLAATFSTPTARRPFHRQLADKAATTDEFRKAIAAMQRDHVQPDDLAVIMLSGHGLESDGQLVFRSFDSHTDSNGKTRGGITGRELANRLAELNCRVILILDTCHSGAAGTAQYLEDEFTLGAGPIVLAACRRNEKAASVRGKGGIFTAGILGALEKLREQPERTVAEWCDDVRNYCLANSANSDQHPEVVPSRTFLGEFERFTPTVQRRTPLALQQR